MRSRDQLIERGRAIWARTASEHTDESETAQQMLNSFLKSKRCVELEITLAALGPAPYPGVKPAAVHEPLRGSSTAYTTYDDVTRDEWFAAAWRRAREVTRPPTPGTWGNYETVFTFDMGASRAMPNPLQSHHRDRLIGHDFTMQVWPDWPGMFGAWAKYPSHYFGLFGPKWDEVRALGIRAIGVASPLMIERAVAQLRTRCGDRYTWRSDSERPAIRHTHRWWSDDPAPVWVELNRLDVVGMTVIETTTLLQILGRIMQIMDPIDVRQPEPPSVDRPEGMPGTMSFSAERDVVHGGTRVRVWCPHQSTTTVFSDLELTTIADPVRFIQDWAINKATHICPCGRMTARAT